MSIRCKHSVIQSGSVLLLMLFLLTGISAAWLTSFNVNDTSLAIRHESVKRSAYVLKEARQTLMSYSALYPYLYGARGAGPGHLPCPDTDGLTVSDLSAGTPSGLNTDDGYLRHGPNPPCGSHKYAQGRFPRHVQLDNQRYVFHYEATQKIAYRVSTSWINNPVNRVVHSGMLLREFDGSLRVAATLSIEDTHGLGSRNMKLPVYQRQLVAGVKPAVASWLLEKVQSARLRLCLNAMPTTQPVSEPSVQGKTDSQSDLGCPPVATSVPPCSNDAVLSFIVDDYRQSAECLDDRLHSMTIDGVPALRHWFIRNQWMDWIHTDADSACMGKSIQDCALSMQVQFDSLNRALDERTVSMRWVVL